MQLFKGKRYPRRARVIGRALSGSPLQSIASPELLVWCWVIFPMLKQDRAPYAVAHGSTRTPGKPETALHTFMKQWEAVSLWTVGPQSSMSLTDVKNGRKYIVTRASLQDRETCLGTEIRYPARMAAEKTCSPGDKDWSQRLDTDHEGELVCYHPDVISGVGSLRRHSLSVHSFFEHNSKRNTALFFKCPSNKSLTAYPSPVS